MILVAPDKFKGTFSAGEIASRLAEWLAGTSPGNEIVTMPMADGGEGTAAALAEGLGLDDASISRLDDERPAYNALGQETQWTFFRRGDIAAVDSSTILGLVSMDRRRPMEASSRPLGELVRWLIRDGVTTLYIGVGGTLTTDGGAGFLQGLGLRFFNRHHDEILEAISPKLLPSVASIAAPKSAQSSANSSANSLTRLIPEGVRIIGLIDVDVPLLNDSGQALSQMSDSAITLSQVSDSGQALSLLSFAPQKGVTPDQLPELRRAISHWQDIVAATTGNLEDDHYCGAGGGLGYALRLINADCRPGAKAIFDLLIQRKHLSTSDITEIYTGEGSFDAQSLAGKVTGMLISFALSHHLPLTIVCGQNHLPASLLPTSITILPLTALFNS